MTAVSRRTKLGAALLLGLFLFAMAVLIADRYVDAAYRHVVVEASNVDDTARVDVNCRRALSLAASEGTKSVDLGWLGPGDRVYLSSYNERGGAAWGFELSNGEEVLNLSDGHAGVTGSGAGPYGVAMAELVTADGNRLGAIGCAPPALVSESVPDYQQSLDMQAVLDRDEEAPLWDAPTFPYALIETLADLVPLFALIGFVAAASIARVRHLIRRHRVISLAFGLFNLFVSLTTSTGWHVLLVWFEVIGLTLLLVSAVVAVWPHTGSCCLTSCSTPEPEPNPE